MQWNAMWQNVQMNKKRERTECDEKEGKRERSRERAKAKVWERERMRAHLNSIDKMVNFPGANLLKAINSFDSKEREKIK